MPEYARVCQSIPEYAKVCKNMPEYARFLHFSDLKMRTVAILFAALCFVLAMKVNHVGAQQATYKDVQMGCRRDSDCTARAYGPGGGECSRGYCIARPRNQKPVTITGCEIAAACVAACGAANLLDDEIFFLPCAWRCCSAVNTICKVCDIF